MTAGPVLSLWRGNLNLPTNGWGVTISPAVRDAFVKDVAQRHSVLPREIMGGELSRKVAHARQEVMWRLRSLKAGDGRPKHSYPAIAHALGLADHTTVIHGVRAHEKRIATQ